MKRLLILLLGIFLFACSSPIRAQEETNLYPSWSVYFSPNGHCTEVIIKELDKAKTSVLVQAYSFTSDPISKALLNAHKRGVKVEVILDKSRKREKNSSADSLAQAGIPIKIDAAHAIAHNKVIIVDGETVISGSFNFTRAAEDRNAENLLVIRDKTLAEKYIRNWQEHAGHSQPFIGKAEGKCNK
jgi:phosphatidylserine/phosphatidylglycerophosphate/cardiolipin synthase-like enzyme